MSVLVLLAFTSTAQIKDPVKWTANSIKKEAGMMLYLLLPCQNHGIFTLKHTGEGGPIPTTLKFTKNPLVTFDGEVKEVGKLKKNMISCSIPR